MSAIFVDGDACPVREEIYQVAVRLALDVFVASNGSRPIRPPGTPVLYTPAKAGGFFEERLGGVRRSLIRTAPKPIRCAAATAGRLSARPRSRPNSAPR